MAQIICALLIRAPLGLVLSALRDTPGYATSRWVGRLKHLLLAMIFVGGMGTVWGPVMGVALQMVADKDFCIGGGRSIEGDPKLTLT